MSVEWIASKREQWQIKNKKAIFIFILASFILALPALYYIFFPNARPALETDEYFQLYRGLSFLVIILLFPLGSLIYGIYGLIKKEVLWGYSSPELLHTGKDALLPALAYLLFGLVGLGGIFYFFFIR